MRKFDYTFLKKISVPADIMNSATSIYEMKAKAELRRTDFADVFSAMESVAKIQSVKSSNAIEGIITTDKRIRDIVNKSTVPQGHNELEIAGYRDALDLIHSSYSDIPFSEKAYWSCTECSSSPAATTSQESTKRRTISSWKPTAGAFAACVSRRFPQAKLPRRWNS